MVPRNVFDEEDDEEDEDEDENENKQNTQQEQKHPRTHYCSHVRLTKENTFPFDPGLGASAGEHEGCEIPTPLHWRFAKAWHRSGSHDSGRRRRWVGRGQKESSCFGVCDSNPLVPHDVEGLLRGERGSNLS